MVGFCRIERSGRWECKKSGQVFIAPSGYHTIVKSGRIELSKRPRVDTMGSMDVAMKSAAEVYDDKVIGVLLSGRGKDGAEGMKAIAQDEFISVIFGMSNAAIEMGAVDKVAALQDIVDEIMSVL